MTWRLTKQELGHEELLINESLFTLGNGYLGVRGNFEEDYPDSYTSIRGTYINAFHDETEIPYGEKAYGFPNTQQKLINIMDGQTVQIYLDEELFSLFDGEVLGFERNLHFNRGFSERIIHWRSPHGKEAKFHFRRLVSFITKELFAINIRIEPISEVHHVKIVSTLNGDVSNFVDKHDPRLGSGHAKCLKTVNIRKQGRYSIVQNITNATKLEVACVSTSKIEGRNHFSQSTVTDCLIEDVYSCDGNEPVEFTKYNVFTETLRHENKLIDKGIAIQTELKNTVFDDLLVQQKKYLDDFWFAADIQIEGDKELQVGIRFNLYQLLQSVGKEPLSNIAAKGLSGEGYEGHYFWDTEIFIFPVFLLTNREIAKNLLLYRYFTLTEAKERAKEVGHKRGALFPWRTITGTECSSYFPAGTAQYHISADIAYSYIQYYLVTGDEIFLKEYMAELLFETARLWIDTGHLLEGRFRINGVTGPDEYTCMVNNNYYTNVMAKNNLLWAYKVYEFFKEKDSARLHELANRIGLSESEAAEWKAAGENMYLPYDETYKINAQDDSFLQKERWNLENTPKEKFPLLLHYHPLTIYRYQVCKQADTVLAHFLLEDDQDFETMKNSYDYYEKLTTHDSSLSYCIFSIMASKLGYEEKAYEYFNKTARLDLDNTHGNTKDGLHMANMGGTWLAIVYGFAGLRIKEKGFSFAPFLPARWTSLVFRLQYQGRRIKVKLDREKITYLLEVGEELTIHHYKEVVRLKAGNEVRIYLKKL